MRNITASETQICCAVVEWAEWNNLFLAHFQNEGKRSIAGHILQKKIGTKKGMPDYFLAEPASGYNGMFFEMKSKGKKPDKHQMKILSELSRKGFFSTWFDNVDDAISGIRKYLGWK